MTFEIRTLADGELISVEVARTLLRYEPETGKLFWRARPVSMFSDGKQTAEHVCKRWNGKHAGKEAFTTISRYGYRVGDIFGRGYRAHRVIWAMETGVWPEDELDHINGIRDDNRLENLRAVIHAENAKNQRMHNNNTSGVVGVCWDSLSGKWVAYINAKGKKIHLGLFTTKSEAISVRKSAEIKHGYHANHGRVTA